MGSNLSPGRGRTVTPGESQTAGRTHGAHQCRENENPPARPIPVAPVVTGGQGAALRAQRPLPWPVFQVLLPSGCCHPSWETLERGGHSQCRALQTQHNLTNATVQASGSARTPPRGQAGGKALLIGHLYESRRVLRVECLHGTEEDRENATVVHVETTAVHVLLC